MAPLPRLVSVVVPWTSSVPVLFIQVEFRNKYKIPIFLEESLSFGVLGRTGRGAVEHFDLSVSSHNVRNVLMLPFV